MKSNLIKNTLMSLGLSIGSVFGVGFLANVSYCLDKHSKSPKEPTFLVDAAIAKIDVVPDTLTAVGHLEAFKNVQLSFNINGIMKSLYFKDGQQVQQGALIASLDDKVDQANVDVAKATLLGSKSDYESNLALSKEMAVAKVTLLQKKSKWMQDKANLELQDRTLDLKKLYAPFSGYLGVFKLKEGSYVAQGQNVVALRQISPVRVNYSLPSVYQSDVELAQSVEITSVALPGQKFQGLVSYRAQYVDQDTGTLALEATIKNPNFVLLPGMFVQVTQIIDPNRKLLVIPSISLQTDIDGEFVYVVEDKHMVGNKLYGVVKQRKIKSRLVANNLTAIQKGLKPGDWVISSGQQKLNDGSKIIVANADKLKDATTNKNHKKTNK